jgi:hypothetical protein
MSASDSQHILMLSCATAPALGLRQQLTATKVRDRHSRPWDELEQRQRCLATLQVVERLSLHVVEHKWLQAPPARACHSVGSESPRARFQWCLGLGVLARIAMGCASVKKEGSWEVTTRAQICAKQIEAGRR